MIRRRVQRALGNLPQRWRWTLHNIFAHLASEIAYQCGAVYVADWIHDATIQDHRPGTGRG